MSVFRFPTNLVGCFNSTPQCANGGSCTLAGDTWCSCPYYLDPLTACTTSIYSAIEEAPVLACFLALLICYSIVIGLIAIKWFNMLTRCPRKPSLLFVTMSAVITVSLLELVSATAHLMQAPNVARFLFYMGQSLFAVAYLLIYCVWFGVLLRAKNILRHKRPWRVIRSTLLVLACVGLGATLAGSGVIVGFPDLAATGGSLLILGKILGIFFPAVVSMALAVCTYRPASKLPPKNKYLASIHLMIFLNVNMFVVFTAGIIVDSPLVLPQQLPAVIILQRIIYGVLTATASLTSVLLIVRVAPSSRSTTTATNEAASSGGTPSASTSSTLSFSAAATAVPGSRSSDDREEGRTS